MHDEDNNPIKFHKAQQLTWDSQRRIVAMIAGSQGGKTSFGPWWLDREIQIRGIGDYIAVTASFDLFKLKMLPVMLNVFEHILKIGRYWTGDRVIELKDPRTGEFMAQKASDPMWARIILRSADSLGGLESATAKGAWLDECGQDRFEIAAYRAIRRRVALKRGRILMTTTLYNLGWLSTTIIDPTIADGKQSFYSIGNSEIDYYDSERLDSAVIQFDSTVNPQFPEREYEEAKDLLPEEEFSMFYRGRKATRRFLIYDSFDYTKHTCKPFAIPESWQRYMGIDFGPTHTSAMYYAEEPGTGRLYCYREYLGGGKTIKEFALELLRDEPRLPIAYGGVRSEKQWRTEFGWNGLPIFEPIIDDLNLGINRVYAQHRADGIIYFDNLLGIIDEKGRYRRKRDRSGSPLEEIEQKNTYHRLDAERYIISSIRTGTSNRAKVIRLG